MGDLTGALVRHIDTRLDTMERAPNTWGSSESMDLQALLLLELRTFVLRRRTYENDPYEARDAYIGYVREHFPEAPASFLSSLVPHEDLPRTIGEMRCDVVSVLGAEDPFEVAPIVLEIRFVKGSGAPFSAACRTFCRFERALRAVARAKGRKGAGAVIRLSTPEIRPLDGGAAGVQMIVDTLAAGSAEEPARAALDSALELLCWWSGARDDEPAWMPRAGASRDELLKYIGRLLPRGPIASVRIGGTLAGGAPIVVTREHRGRGTQSRPFPELRDDARLMLKVAERLEGYGQEPTKEGGGPSRPGAHRRRKR